MYLQPVVSAVACRRRQKHATTRKNRRCVSQSEPTCMEIVHHPKDDAAHGLLAMPLLAAMSYRSSWSKARVSRKSEDAVGLLNLLPLKVRALALSSRKAPQALASLFCACQEEHDLGPVATTSTRLGNASKNTPRDATFACLELLRRISSAAPQYLCTLGHNGKSYTGQHWRPLSLQT